jgi:hypothetical protein
VSFDAGGCMFNVADVQRWSVCHGHSFPGTVTRKATPTTAHARQLETNHFAVKIRNSISRNGKAIAVAQ